MHPPTSETAEWPYGSHVELASSYCRTPHRDPDARAIADFVTAACIVVFTLEFGVDHGQSRMSRLLRTILQDGILHLFVQLSSLLITPPPCSEFEVGIQPQIQRRGGDWGEKGTVVY